VRLDLTDTPALVSGTLNLDKLDLDAVTQSADANVEAADRVFPETPLPFDVLKLIDLKLKVEIGELKAQELSFTDLSSDVALQSGSLALDVLSFSLSGASVSGKASADADTQAVALSLKFDDLEMGDLLKTLDAPDRLSGKADVIVDVSGNGASLAAIAGTLDGK
ncbi:MAG: AsmA family protein, partial [Verrucomicrobiales bacterium]